MTKINQSILVSIAVVIAVMAGTKSYASADISQQQIDELIKNNKWAELEKIGMPAVESLIRELNHGKIGNRAQAAVTLGKIKDPRAVEPLGAALKRSNAYLQKTALNALLEINDPRAVKSLVSALKTWDYNIRKLAADALDKFGWEPSDQNEKITYLIATQEWYKLADIGAPAVEPLIDIMREKSSTVTDGAANALGIIGEPAVAPLIEMYEKECAVQTSYKRTVFQCSMFGSSKDEFRYFERALAKALGKTRDPRVVKPLLGTLTHENYRLREEAAKALEKIGWEPSNQEEKITFLIALKNWDELAAMGEPAEEPLIAMLKDNSWTIHDEIVRTLWRFHSKRAIKAIGDVLISGDDEFNSLVRITASKSLGEIDDPDTVPPLIIALKDKEFVVRESAAKVLVKKKDSRSVEPLIEALNDKEPRVLSEAAKALGEIKDARAAEPLAALLKSDKEYLRQIAANALDKIGWKYDDMDEYIEYSLAAGKCSELIDEIGEKLIDPLIKYISSGKMEWRSTGNCLILSAKRLGDPFIERLVGLLEGNDYKVKINLIPMLSKINDPRFVEPLIKALKDDQLDVRMRAANVLGKMKDPRAIQPLIDALKEDYTYDVFYEAVIIALTGFNDPAAVEPLIEALDSTFSRVRMKAAEALGNLGDPRAVEPLLAFLKDEKKSGDIVPTIAAALGNLKDTRAIEPLIELLKDDKNYAGSSAAKALGSIGDPRAVEPLIEAMKHKQDFVRENAAKALSLLGWKPATQDEKITQLIALKKWDELQKIGAPAVPQLIALIKKADRRADKNLIMTLAKINDPRAVEPLMEELKKNIWAMQFVLIDALKELKDYSIEPLIIALKDRDMYKTAMKILTEIGEPAIRQLVIALIDKDVSTRGAAADALESIDPKWMNSEAAKQVIPDIIAALRDDDEIVRNAAAETLVKIGEPAIEPLIMTLRDSDEDFTDRAAAVLERITGIRVEDNFLFSTSSCFLFLRPFTSFGRRADKWERWLEKRKLSASPGQAPSGIDDHSDD